MRSPAPAAVFAAKLEGVRFSGDTLARPRLTDELTGSGSRLVLFSAPPGFGKTTLLAQWRECDPRAFAFVSLDAADNDPVVLWTYIVAAIRRVAPSFGDASLAALHASGRDVSEAVVPAVVGELEAVDQEIVLCLDDYQTVESRACHESIAFFLERAPRTLTLAVSTRVDPPIPIGRLRALGELAELRAADLSFTEAEEAALLNERWLLELPSEDLALLREQTEGWPVGVHLAGMSLRNVDDQADFVRRFGGASRHVVDYLTEVALDTLEPERRTFLLETSILDSMCGPLCDSATGREGSAELLVELERANIFLVPLDDRREWYRYHQLFADVLRNQILRTDPERVAELHRRASEWLAAEGDTTAAARHAVAGGDVEAAADVVSASWRPSFDLADAAKSLRRLETLPAGAVANDARLSFVEAWALSVLGRRDEALAALAAAEAANGDSGDTDTELLRACFPSGDADRMLVAALRASEPAGEPDTMCHPTALLALGSALCLAGEPERARLPFERAVLHGGRAEQPYVVAAAKAGLARVCLAGDDVHAAEALARQAVELVLNHDLAGRRGAGVAEIALGAALGRRGETEAADLHLERGLANLRAGAEELFLADALLVAAPVRRARGLAEEARALLAEAKTLVERCSNPGTLRRRLEEVARTLTPAHRRIEGDSDLTERELEVLRYLAEGLPKREIGQVLFLSFNTIHSHTKSIYQKLRVSSRQAAIERARELGAL